MVMEAHPTHQMEAHPAHSLDPHQSGHAHEARTLEAHQLENSRAMNDKQMEPNPTPQCVGLEFVRQYYTILNKAPWHLHRFYATNSSFMHSGENSNRQAVIGQSNIHKNIMELEFEDCHAKIILIDSQSTITQGIVIQVTGELSNRGSPMRRFMQTFVLAPQSEKKYYVHNDIFRYQDQVFNEDTGSQVDEVSDEVETEEAVIVEPEVVRVNGTSSVPPVQQTVQPTPLQQAPPSPPSPPQQHITSPPPPPQQQQITSPPPQQHITSPPPQQHTTSPPCQVDAAPVTNSSTNKQDSWNDSWNGAPSNDWISNDPIPAEVPAVVSAQKRQPLPKQEKKASASSAPPQQRSYAGFFKDTTSAPPVQPAVVQPSAPQQQPPRDTAPRATTQQSVSTRSERGSAPVVEGGFQRAGRGGRGVNFRQRNSTNFSESEDSESVTTDGYGGETARRRTAPPDTHQIFVGNLPQSVKEEELKKAFQTYGAITDVRINIGKGKLQTPQNGNSKNPASHVVPNFGFVSFSDDAAVAKCLKDRPITILGDHRLNVEEKKTKSKSDSFAPRPQGFRNSMGGRGGSNRMEGGRGGQRGGYNSAINRQR